MGGRSPALLLWWWHAAGVNLEKRSEVLSADGFCVAECGVRVGGKVGLDIVVAKSLEQFGAFVIVHDNDAARSSLWDPLVGIVMNVTLPGRILRIVNPSECIVLLAFHPVKIAIREGV